MLKLNEPLTPSNLIEMVKIFAIVGGLIWAAAAFTTQSRGQGEATEAKVSFLKTEVIDMRRESAKIDTRLSVVENDIRHIRESLTRIEQWLRASGQTP